MDPVKFELCLSNWEEKLNKFDRLSLSTLKIYISVSMIPVFPEDISVTVNEGEKNCFSLLIFP